VYDDNPDPRKGNLDPTLPKPDDKVKSPEINV